MYDAEEMFVNFVSLRLEFFLIKLKMKDRNSASALFVQSD